MTDDGRIWEVRSYPGWEMLHTADDYWAAERWRTENHKEAVIIPQWPGETHEADKHDCPICRMPKDTCAVGACPGALRGGFKLPYEFDPAELAKYQIQGGFQRGDRVAFQYLDGPIHVGTVQDMTYTSGTPAIYPTLTRWQRITRRLTPRRWRKPIKPIREATLPEMTITATQFDDDWAYVNPATAAPTPTGTIIDGLIKTEPGEPK